MYHHTYSKRQKGQGGYIKVKPRWHSTRFYFYWNPCVGLEQEPCRFSLSYLGLQH